MLRWSPAEVREVELAELGESYARYRLSSRESEQAMVQSLSRYGQISPIVVSELAGRLELLDGFKRLAAARSLKSFGRLTARFLETDERTAKAAIYALNRVGCHINQLEEAWIVHALVREDGLSQVEVAELLGRHKSWVCRRLALLEKLGAEATEELRLGLLSASAARELTRLPTGNQAELLQVLHRESLSLAELRRVTDLLVSAWGRRQQEYVLAHPRQALAQAGAVLAPASDPRLSRTGNRVSRELDLLLNRLARMEHWLRHRGLTELSFADRKVLTPALARLSRDAPTVGELAADVVAEIEVAVA